MSLIFSLHRKQDSNASPNAPSEAISFQGTQGKTIILVHGLTGTPNEMRYLAFYFHKRGYTVNCPTLANHGQSLNVLKRTTWEELYQSVRTAFLEATESGEKVFVAGLSMSALFVLLLAEEFPDRVTAGICLAPTLFFDGWNVPWYNRLMPIASHTPLKYSFYFKENAPYGIKNERIRAMVHRFYSNAKLEDMDGVSKFGYPFFPVSLLYQLHRLVRTVTPRLPAIKSPTLLIHPQEDDTASLKNSQLIYDRISSTKKQLVVLSDSYHVITADQEREKVAEEMYKFIEAL